MADTTSLHLRLPKSLYKRLQRPARRNNVSLNTEIVNQLSNLKDPGIAALEEKMPGFLRDAIASLQRDGWVEIDVQRGARAHAESERRIQDMRAIPEREKGEEQK